MNRRVYAKKSAVAKNNGTAGYENRTGDIMESTTVQTYNVAGTKLVFVANGFDFPILVSNPKKW
ncbi:hypothetical protein BLNAU_17733 [Blattamonas nauphoetae]|uniref:Uncharacterized protein n=1 Tax=Blattamonas nauphoetae TaxID=2049346 RepID=A0ABQ9X6D9_9EUKA|nr:hypothetical protein BLNAU_17733 [Blattamonas nauphoetae]